jgi:hypothetical protein
MGFRHLPAAGGEGAVGVSCEGGYVCFEEL